MLELKGCGGLRWLQLACPALAELDATFCSALEDAGLAEVGCGVWGGGGGHTSASLNACMHGFGVKGVRTHDA